MSSTPSPLHDTRRFRDWTSVRYGLAWAYEGLVPPTARTGTYTSPEVSCWLVRRGNVVLSLPGRRAIRAVAGDWVFVARPTRHQAFSEDAEILSMHFYFSWPGQEAVIEQPDNVVFPASEYPELERTARSIVRLVKRHFPRADAFLPEEACSLPLYLRLQHLLPLWISAYLEVQARRGTFPKRTGDMDDRVRQAILELDHQPLSRKFSETELMTRTGLGRSQLHLLFVRTTGLTPKRFFERRRLEAARRLIENTRMSAKEIAMDLGFRYESHFSQWFRAKTGQPPLSLRTKPTKPIS
ncbi:AraC family transcriptional regulator [Opitutaceae bacterium TAV4]|nr:AraC family transcriptional regulator [Opitutaceae bacterium TAV4]RRJ99364.1 AraC family transcriptional regulator [Opitutaceae bacterium TAV3]